MNSWSPFLTIPFCAAAFAACSSQPPEQPKTAQPEAATVSISQAVFTNPNFPITQDTINTPEVLRPAVACSEVVRVGGVHRGATVIVQDGAGATIGERIDAPSGHVEVTLSRPLTATDELRVIQQVNGVESPLSRAMSVDDPPNDLSLPAVRFTRYECAVGTVAHGLTPGASVTLQQSGNTLGQRWATHDVHGFGHAPLNMGDGLDITVSQSVCGDDGPSNTSPVEILVDDPEPMPTPKMAKPQAGTQFVRAENLVPGARLRIQKIVNGQLANTFFSTANGTNVSVYMGETIQDGWRYRFGQELCGAPSFDKPAEADPLSKLPQKLRPPELLGPVCENAPYILAKAALPGGEFVLLTQRPQDNTLNYIRRAPVSLSSTYSSIDTRHPQQTSATQLPAGTQVEVLQLLPNGAQSSTTGTTVVSSGSQLHALNLNSYTDQVTQQVYQGIDLKDNSGPTVLYQECCPVGDGVFSPTDLTATVDQIDENGNVLSAGVGSFQMKEQAPGRYAGRWLWFDGQGENLPQFDERYRINVASRCGNPGGQLELRVIQSDVDINDSSPPTEASLKISQGPSNAQVTLGGGANTINIEPGKTSSLTIEGLDDQGIKKVEVLAIPARSGFPVIRNFDAQAPIPRKVKFSIDLDEFYPTEQASLQVRVTNFANDSVTTELLSIVANTAAPDVSAVTPQAFYKEDRLTITGQNLYFDTPDLETRVRYTRSSTSQEEVVIVDSSSANISETTDTVIKRVRGPLSLNTDALDEVTVEVGLGTPGDIDDLFTWSSPFVLSAMERESGDWTEVKHDDMLRMNSSCSGDTGSVESVQVRTTADLTDPLKENLRLRIKRKDDEVNFETINISVYKATTATRVGGYFISPNCRTIAVLSFSGEKSIAGADIPRFKSRFYYFTDSNNYLTSKSLDPTNLYRFRDTNSSQGAVGEFVPRAWRMHISPDATVAAINHVQIIRTFAPNPGIEVFSSIQDLLKGLSSQVGSNNASTYTCSETDLCHSSVEMDSRNVKVKLAVGPQSTPTTILSKDLD